MGIKEWEQYQRQQGNETAAKMAHVLFEAFGDVPPASDSAQPNAVESSRRALNAIIKELKTKPHTPELFTKYWQIKLSVDGKKAKLAFEVPECDRTLQEISDLEKSGRTLVYLPDELATKEGLVLLGKMYPKMQSWSTGQNTTVVSEGRKGGWLDIEASIDAPNLNTTEADARMHFAQNGLDGQRLSAYILGSQQSHDLTGRYFDTGNTWSRLLGSCYDSGVVIAYFNSDGNLVVNSLLNPDNHNPNLGARSEGVKRT